MKQLKTFWIINALAMLVSATAVNGASPNVKTNRIPTAEYQVVGVTSTQTKGSALFEDQFGNTLRGFAAMDALCRSEVDPNSRMATVREWQAAPRIKTLDDGQFVWLDPGHVAIVYQPDSPNDVVDWRLYTDDGRPFIAADAESPFGLQHRTFCAGYRSDDENHGGMVGTSDHNVSATSCDNTLRVGCAALVAVPVRP